VSPRLPALLRGAPRFDGAADGSTGVVDSVLPPGPAFVDRDALAVARLPVALG